MAVIHARRSRCVPPVAEGAVAGVSGVRRRL